QFIPPVSRKNQMIDIKKQYKGIRKKFSGELIVNPPKQYCIEKVMKNVKTINLISCNLILHSGQNKTEVSPNTHPQNKIPKNNHAKCFLFMSSQADVRQF
ncbi:hypothetical protein LJC22_06840, partial [Desulfosarcina sp. OttesenSCG-928-G10]|nr:hypothetical protein [Desulfosarcina sp. OttesenSCG-928-G10]